jgi:hypothetical protein
MQAGALQNKHCPRHIQETNLSIGGHFGRLLLSRKRCGLYPMKVPDVATLFDNLACGVGTCSKSPGQTAAFTSDVDDVWPVEEDHMRVVHSMKRNNAVHSVSRSGNQTAVLTSVSRLAPLRTGATCHLRVCDQT